VPSRAYIPPDDSPSRRGPFRPNVRLFTYSGRRQSENPRRLAAITRAARTRSSAPCWSGHHADHPPALGAGRPREIYRPRGRKTRRARRTRGGTWPLFPSRPCTSYFFDDQARRRGIPKARGPPGGWPRATGLFQMIIVVERRHRRPFPFPFPKEQVLGGRWGRFPPGASRPHDIDIIPWSGRARSSIPPPDTHSPPPRTAQQPSPSLTPHRSEGRGPSPTRLRVSGGRHAAEINLVGTMSHRSFPACLIP